VVPAASKARFTLESASPREFIHRWLLALGCFATLIFFFSPSWAAFDVWSRVPELGAMLEVRRGGSVLLQVAHPGRAIPDPLHAAIQWRLLFPLIGHVLNLPASWFFALAHVGGVLVLGFVVSVLRRNGFGFNLAAAAALIFGAADWFFATTGWLGYFDSWVVLALLIVAFARSSWAVWFACAWAPWIDERFVLGAPLALLCRYLAPAGANTQPAFRRDLAIAGALLGAFVVVRLGLLAGHSAAGATPGGYLAKLDFAGVPAERVALGLWEGVRAGWIFVLAGIVLLGRQSAAVDAAAAASPRPPASRWRLALALVIAAITIVGLRTAQDFGRSMMFISPAVLFGFIIAQRSLGTALRPLLYGGALATLVLPAHHVMSDRVNPIYYLYHELAAFENPPPAVMPEMFELGAIREMEEGKFAQAESDLTVAIKLATNPAAPAKQRGVLRASQGRWQDARGDFALMAQHEPENPDAWFMCAQAELALKNPSGARTAMQRALGVAKPDWSTRPDVARFQARLNQP
jgi:hypothetical protein